MGDAKHLVEELMKGASVREVLESSKAVPRFPEKIFIVVYPSTNIGYVYEKTYEHEGGGCYYRSKENTHHPHAHMSFHKHMSMRVVGVITGQRKTQVLLMEIL